MSQVFCCTRSLLFWIIRKTLRILEEGMEDISKHLKHNKHPLKWKKNPASIAFFGFMDVSSFIDFFPLISGGTFTFLPPTLRQVGRGHAAISAAISTGHPSICPPSTGNFLSEGRVIPWFPPTKFPTSKCSLKFMIKCPKLALKMDGWQMKFLSGMANF